MQSLPTAASEGGLHFVDPVISPPLKPTCFSKAWGSVYGPKKTKTHHTSLVISE